MVAKATVPAVDFELGLHQPGDVLRREREPGKITKQ